MMMETVVYSREYLFVKELYDKGRARPDPVPSRQPPAGHGRLARLLARFAADALRDALRQPLPGDSSASTPKASSATARAAFARSSSQDTAAPSPSRPPRSRSRTATSWPRSRAACSTTARQYRESFDVYRIEEVSFEWQQVEGRRSGDSHQSTAEPRGARNPRACQSARLRAACLPEPIRKFTQPAAIQDAEHLSFLQGGGHGGSHPHLAHNFLMACLGEKPAMPDAATSANWTMVGICAHQSALKGGEKIAIPRF